MASSSSKSIVGLHSELSANASKFVNEYARADNASRRHGKSIRDEMDKTMSAVQKKWSAPKLAIGLLKGLGLGGGMGLAHLLYDKIAEAWNRAAEEAKEFQESLQKAVEHTRQLREVRLQNLLTDDPERGQKATENQLEAWKNEYKAARLARWQAQKDLGVLKDAPFGTMSGGGGDPTQGRYGVGLLPNAYFKKVQEAEQEAANDMQRLEELIDKWTRTLTKSVTESSKKNQEAMAKWLKPFNDKIAAANKKQADDAEKLRDAIATPAEKYARRASEIVALRTALVNPIDDRTARRGLAKAWADYQKEVSPFDDPRYRRYEQAARDFGRPDEMARRGMGMGGSYADRTSKIETVLDEIAKLIRQAISNGWEPSYTD